MSKSDVLFLTQRIPYPPIKGEKIRPLQIIRYLREQNNLYLGCLVDDPSDWQHTGTVSKLAQEAYFAPLNPKLAKLACLRGLLSGEPLSFTYFHNNGLNEWVNKILTNVKPKNAFVCSTNMFQYINHHPYRPDNIIVDYADVDSEKWREYATTTKGPMKYVYAREHKLVAKLELEIARESNYVTFVSEAETKIFKSLYPAAGAKAHAVSSGVDSDYFDPNQKFDPPYNPKNPTFVFCGTMDYHPNVDAVEWFSNEIFPNVLETIPNLQFYIVGSSPHSKVQALAKNKGIYVTGRVPDVRPYLSHAVASVAPVRIARGIQNKVLEAMSMAMIVIATPQALEGINVKGGHNVIIAENVGDFISTIEDLALRGGHEEIGTAARKCVVENYNWSVRLKKFNQFLK